MSAEHPFSSGPTKLFALVCTVLLACGDGPDGLAGSSAAVTTQSVVSFTLINADTDQPISGFDPMPPGAILDVTRLPTSKLNVRANTSPATVGSVRFALDASSNSRTENVAPYALAGGGELEVGDLDRWLHGQLLLRMAWS